MRVRLNPGQDLAHVGMPLRRAWQNPTRVGMPLHAWQNPTRVGMPLRHAWQNPTHIGMPLHARQDLARISIRHGRLIPSRSAARGVSIGQSWSSSSPS